VYPTTPSKQFPAAFEIKVSVKYFCKKIVLLHIIVKFPEKLAFANVNNTGVVALVFRIRQTILACPAFAWGAA
jgi:hypothetical protein